jgi:ribonuclease HI
MSISASVGDRVGDSNTTEEDTSQPIEDTAIVIGISNKPANKYEVKPEVTVKDLNPKYPADDRVILVVFESHLESIIPNWAFLSSKELTQKVMRRDVKTYAYPESRLFYINHGLLDGVVINVSGVADPESQESGAYSYTIKSEDNVIYEESNFIEYGGSYVSKSTVVYEGIISALKWVTQNRPDNGVLIRTDNEVCVNQLNGKYDVRDEGEEMLLYEVELLLDELPYYVTSVEPQYNQEELIEKSKSEYKKSVAPKIEDV